MLELVRDLKLPLVRYPGGNFVSAYNWEDGIGPKAERPVRLDLAWRTRETNEVGTDEFARWCEAAGTEMMLAVNLGSRGLDAARAPPRILQSSGRHLLERPRASRTAIATPTTSSVWCLGNEMDGPWQVGHKTADEYGRLANETAKAMRAYDPNARARRLRLLAQPDADLSRSGKRPSSTSATTTSTTSRSTCISRTTRTITSISWRSRWSWTAISRRSAA